MTIDQKPIRLIVGLGNPGPKYEKTRHNAGTWFVERLFEGGTKQLTFNKKFNGLVGQFELLGHRYDVLIPETYMNRSGQAVGAFAKFYKIPSQAILVVHDELDFLPGTVRFKQGGGSAGHKGLLDIIAHLGNRNFSRIRIGIGHPSRREDRIDYALNRPSKSEQIKIDQAIDRAVQALPLILNGNFQEAMNQLHVDPMSDE